MNKVALWAYNNIRLLKDCGEWQGRNVFRGKGIGIGCAGVKDYLVI